MTLSKTFVPLVFFSILSNLLLSFQDTLAATNENGKPIRKMITPILSLLLDEQSSCVGDIDDLLTLRANSVFNIECEYDLQSSSIIFPSNISLHAKGGKLFNGTLHFGAASKIDHELVTYSLTIQGDVSLNSHEFTFNKSHWGIVEGRVSNLVSTNNRERIQNAIDLAKRLGANVFKIEDLDAYFDTHWLGGRPAIDQLKAIRLPSDFNLKLADTTKLRMQPSHLPWGALLLIKDQQNVTVTGGHFYGDRFEHDYVPIRDFYGVPRNTHEWPVLALVQGSENVLIDNIATYDSTGDGVVFGSSGRRTDPQVPFNLNVTLQNSTITRSRRNGISITDGEDLKVINCDIKDTGLGERGNTIISSAGVAPQFGLDVEPFLGYETDGTPIFFEKVENVLIEGNRFTNNAKGSIIDYSGIDVVISKNTSDNVFGIRNASGTQFIGNTIIGSLPGEEIDVFAGITTGSRIIEVNGEKIELSKDFVIKDNVIKGVSKGIDILGGGGIVEGNLIEDFSFVGIFLGNSQNYSFTNNTIKNPRERHAQGIANLSNASVENTTFDRMIISMPWTPISFRNLNTSAVASNNKVLFQNSTLTSLETGRSILVRHSNGVEFRENDFINTFLRIEGSAVTDINNRLCPSEGCSD